MKVRELILQLQKCDQDRVVLVEGYEGGYCNPAVCQTMAVLGRSKPYEGDHDYAYEWDDEEIKTACILIRKD
jgi:hypothetical protein